MSPEKPKMPEGTPKFESMEELQKWLDSQNAIEDIPQFFMPSKEESTSKKKSSSSPKKKQSTSKPKKKKAAPDEAAILAKPNPNVWSTVHFYTRPGDTLNVARNDAKEEAKFRNNNVLVFYHDHVFGGICKPSCAEVVK